MLITSLENERIKNYIKLKSKKYRDLTNTFIVEGEHLVLEAYRAGLLEEIILEQSSVFPIDLPNERKVYVPQNILDKISDVENPPYVMGLCRKKEESDNLGSRILMLDGVQDPGNLGTILRSSKAFNVDTVVLSLDTVDLYNPKVIRATQGMLFHMNVVRRDLVDEINKLKSEEIPIYVTRVEYGEDIRYLKAKDKRKFALVMGNEGKGVREEIKDLADKYIYIEMNDMVESLNVGVATSILLYELQDKGEQKVQDFVYIGKIVNTHGIKGELRLLSKFSYKERVFVKGMTIYIGRNKEKEEIVSYRHHKCFEMITLKGYSNINEVLKYKGALVYVDRYDLKLSV